MRRVPALVAAVVLAPLLWSCESEQTGYDVKLPLVGPMEFDETSCEGSGDVCSADADCIDEDGFNDGPCTKTMEVLEPITQAVSLSPASPSYTLNTPDTSRWIAPFVVQQSGRGFPVDMTMDNFSLQGGPVTISVRVFSRTGRIAGQDLGYQPTTPSSCAFTLNDGATGEDYAGGIHTCLRDWIDENGAPLDFDMEVTSSAGAAPAAAAAKSGFGLKQQGAYLVEGEWTQLTSEEECESDYTTDVLEAIEEGNDFFGLLSCSDLLFEGNGTTAQPIDISGGSIVWDQCGNYLGMGLLLSTSLGVGSYTVTVYANDAVVEVAQDVPAIFFPSPDVFVEALLSAAAGRCESGTPDGLPLAVAWWDHCGPEPPPTRTGSIDFAAAGFCEVDQGSGAAGGSGGQ
jgi:hypothetical protein